MTYSTAWHYICVAASVAAVEADLSAQLQSTTDAGPNAFSGTFGVPLSADSLDPATHYGGSSPVDDSHLDTIFAALPAWEGVVQMWRGYRDGHDDASALVFVLAPYDAVPEGAVTVIAPGDPLPPEAIADSSLVRYGWRAALALAGLQVIEPQP